MYKESAQGNDYLTIKVHGKKIKIPWYGDVVTQTEMDHFITKIIAYYRKLYSVLFSYVYSEKAVEGLITHLAQWYVIEDLARSDYKKSLPVQAIIDSAMGYFSTNRIADFVYHSNKIEGSRTPHEQVQLFWNTGEAGLISKQEEQELRNSKRAREYLFDGFTFTEKGVKRLYHILTKDLFMENGVPYPKGYKKTPNIAGNEPTTLPKDVSQAMGNLLHRYQDNKKTLDPLTLAFHFHLRFEKIHPFTDGNGRTGRMIMNKMLVMRHCPPLVIFNENRKRYFAVFEKPQNQFYEFLVEQYNKTFSQLTPQ